MDIYLSECWIRYWFKIALSFNFEKRCILTFVKMSFCHFFSGKQNYTLVNDKPKKNVLKITSNAGKKKIYPKDTP
jgi:hypothetical protein